MLAGEAVVMDLKRDAQPRAEPAQAELTLPIGRQRSRPRERLPGRFAHGETIDLLPALVQPADAEFCPFDANSFQSDDAPPQNHLPAEPDGRLLAARGRVQGLSAQTVPSATGQHRQTVVAPSLAARSRQPKPALVVRPASGQHFGSGRTDPGARAVRRFADQNNISPRQRPVPQAEHTARDHAIRAGLRAGLLLGGGR